MSAFDPLRTSRRMAGIDSLQPSVSDRQHSRVTSSPNSRFASSTPSSSSTDTFLRGPAVRLPRMRKLAEAVFSKRSEIAHAAHPPFRHRDSFIHSKEARNGNNDGSLERAARRR